MKITKEHIQALLEHYHIYNDIKEMIYFIEYYKGNGELETKVIAKVVFNDRDPVVIKIVNDDRYSNHVIEEQSVFSEHLRANGILTPKRFKANDIYCNQTTIDHEVLSITVEEYIGEEIKEINSDIAYKIGELFGRIHSISERDNCHICNKTIFDVMGYNEVSGYEKFIELTKTGKLDKRLVTAIQEQYQYHITELEKIWHQLPRYATQGDVSINNLSWIEGDLAIFDYNIAGDEVLIGDMILEALLTSYEMDMIDKTEDRTKIFTAFVQGYRTQRELSPLEEKTFLHIYAISDAFWFTKIRYNDNSLSKLIENENTHEILGCLNQMLAILNGSCCM